MTDSAAPLPAVSGLLLRALCKRGAAPPPAVAPLQSVYRCAGLDPAVLARYDALLGYPADAMPVSVAYLPVQRAHLATLLHPGFPFRIAGMVHLANELIEYQRVAAASAFTLSTTARTEQDDTGAWHCHLETTACAGDLLLFVCRSHYLARRGSGRRAARPARPTLPGVECGNWLVAAGDGRAYAAVSGDWNPIHLWTWSARLFGMKAPLIHGMQSVARSGAVLERALGRRLTRLQAQFSAPLPLGSEASLFADLEGGAYAVQAAGRIVLHGHFA